MDNKQLFTRFEYLPTSAVLKNNTKCVDVVLVYKQHVVTKSLYIPNKSGMKSSDFVDEAKKLINKQLNSGELEAYAEAQIKKEKKKKKGLIVCFSCLGVLALAGGAGVATYYSLRHKGPEVKVSIPKIEGLNFTNTRAYAGEDFDTKITVDTSKTDGKVLPDKLTKVSSGNREVKPTEYTYSITDEAKETATLHIPGKYIEDTVTISLELVKPGPTPVVSDYTEIKYHYSGEEAETGDHNIGFAFTTTDDDVTVDWGDGKPVAVTSPATSPVLGNDATIKVYGDTDTIAFFNSGEDDYYQWGNVYITSIIFAKHITTIDDMACPYMANLETVSLSEGITSVGMGAFYQCISLKNLWLPNTLTSIGENAFQYLSSLNTITVEEGNPNYSSEGSNLIEVSSKRLICGSNASSIPDDIKIIDELAFMGLQNLQNIVIPSALTEIGTQAFWNAHMKSLSFGSGFSLTKLENNSIFRSATIDENIVFPNSLTIFDDGLFRGAKLAFENNTFILPSGIIEVEEESFKSASGFSTVVLDSNISKIGYEAFDGCQNLSVVDGTALTAANVPSLGTNCFPKNAGLQIKLASAEIRDAFLAASKGWNAYESYIIVP